MGSILLQWKEMLTEEEAILTLFAASEIHLLGYCSMRDLMELDPNKLSFSPWNEY